jgi:histidinol-phosphate aminotransferase
MHKLFAKEELMPDTVLKAGPTPRSAVMRMKEYHPPLGDRSGLRLDFNENTLECSPRVREVLRRISLADLTRYPERDPVEQRVAESLGLDASQVLLTNGVDEAIHVLCQTYLGPDGEMLMPVPTYSMYEIYASATGAQICGIQAAPDFVYPHQALLAAITPATRIIAIANPNSPTGSVVTRAQILEIAERAPNAVLLIDEAYFHFFGETVVDLVGRVPNLIVARTFSKAYGLAGLRVGVLAAPEGQMHWLRRVISPYSVNSVALACLPAALEDETYLRWYVAEVLEAREEFVAALDLLGVQHWPSRANFILIHIGPGHREFAEAMRARNVLVRDRSGDPGCDGCVRVTIGTRDQMKTSVTALHDVLNILGWKNGA